MIHSNTTDLAVKIQKMARLAFDPAAAEGEAGNAATMIVQIARKNGLNFDGFKKLIGVASSTSRLKPNYPSGVMPFGKYEGVAFDEIFESNPSYLDWFLKTVKGNEKVKDQIAAFLKSKQN
jgi:uncharacterized protein (DUF3820 family)